MGIKPLLSTAVVCLILLSCGGTPAAPGPGSAAPPIPAPQPALSGTLSGDVFEVGSDGTRKAIRGGQLSIEVEVNNVNDPHRGGWVPVGADGRYRLPDVPGGRFVKVSAAAVGDVTRYRFCAIHTFISGDTELDVPLFLPGAALPSPTLSGQVFSTIDGTRVPVVGVGVYFQSRAYGPDVVGYTDSAGRYELCGIPPIPGRLYMFCANDIQPYTQHVDIRGNTVVDIDTTGFRTCLV